MKSAQTTGVRIPFSQEDLRTNQVGLEDFPTQEKEEKNLSQYDFMLVGMGGSGKDCGKNRVSQVGVEKDSDNPDVAIKYEPLNCKRLGCPDCYNREVIKRIFDMVFRIEAYAKINAVRPVLALGSVPPTNPIDWNRTRLNNSLFRRFRRRGGKFCNIGGGIHFFHPFRIKRKFKRQLQNEGYGKGTLDAGYWRGVREDVLSLGSWRKYTKFGCHIHNIVFPKYEDVFCPECGADWDKQMYGGREGDITSYVCSECGYEYDDDEIDVGFSEHRGDDYMIRFKDDGNRPKRLSLSEVIAYCKYFFSHIGVKNHSEGSVLNSYFKSVRPFGCLYHFSPEEHLGEKEIKDLKKEIANNIFVGENEDGDKETMKYDKEKNELVFPHNADSEEDRYMWIDVWNLKEFLNSSEYEEVRNMLREKHLKLIQEIWSFCWILGKAPPYDKAGITYSDPELIEGVEVYKPREISVIDEKDNEHLE